MLQQLKEQQDRIENKLDILLAAMSAHPEFGALVKQGKRNMYREEKIKELKEMIAVRERRVWPNVISFIETGTPCKLNAILSGIDNNYNSMVRLSPSEKQERAREEVVKALEDREGNPELAQYLDHRIGLPIDFEKELTQIMNAYDKQQESAESNL